MRQAGLSGSHTPAEQLPLQQAAEALQAWLSATQAEPQTPPEQVREQQSVGTEQGPPAGVHWLMDDTQVLVAVSQMLEQHWDARVHVSPLILQPGAAPPEPPTALAPPDVPRSPPPPATGAAPVPLPAIGAAPLPVLPAVPVAPDFESLLQETAAYRAANMPTAKK